MSELGRAPGTDLSGKVEFVRVHAFELQQTDLFVEASGVSGKTAVGSHHAMAGNDDGNGIVPHGTAYGLGRHVRSVKGFGGKSGELFVGDDFAAGNTAQRLPDELPERTSCRSKGQFAGGGATAGEIPVEPACRQSKNGQITAGTGRFLERALKVFLTVHPETDEVDAVSDKRKRADG